MTTTLLIIGALIILVLGGYAVHLLLKLKKQTQQQTAQLAAQQAASEAREKELLGNIHYIAAAMLEELERTRKQI